MEKIKLESELEQRKIKILAYRLSTTEEEIKKALDLANVPDLKYKSEAKDIYEARTEFFSELGNTNEEKQKAALRKWLEFCIDKEEIGRIFRYAKKDSFEKILAIKKMAELK